MTTKPKGNSSGFRLNTAEGGIIMIGRDADDTRVAGKPDGSVFVGSAERPMLVRMPEGNVMLALNEDFFAHILPDGQLLILSGDENLTFSPSGNVMISSTESNERAHDFRLQMTLMAADLLRQEVNFSTTKMRENSEGLRLVTTRSGSAQVSQGKSPISLIGRRDGAVYVGSRNQQFLGRLPNGDILFCMAEDFAALIRPSGRMTICSTFDTIEFAPGTGMTLSAGENNLLASEIHQQLVELSEEITKPVPAASRPVQAAAPEPVEMVVEQAGGEPDDPVMEAEPASTSEPLDPVEAAGDETFESPADMEDFEAAAGSAPLVADLMDEDVFVTGLNSVSPLRLVNQVKAGDTAAPLDVEKGTDPAEAPPTDAPDVILAGQPPLDILPSAPDPLASMLAGKKSITEDVFPENIFALR